MGDDLAAFFAKKSNKKDKKKKSGVINIEDVGNHLERKARRNELEDFEDDEDLELLKLTKTSVEPSNVNNNAEDSEWIDFSGKPTLAGLNIKELQEHEDEVEDYERTPREPTKGWNSNSIAEKEEVAKENVIVPAKTLYKAPGSRKEPKVDLNSDFAFPSLSEAPIVEKEIKKLEEQQKIEEIEKRREEEKRKEERMKLNNLRGGGMDSSGRYRYEGRSSEQKPMVQEKQENEEVDNWRKMQTTPRHQPNASPQHKVTTPSVRTELTQSEAQPASKADGGWRESTSKAQEEKRKIEPLTTGADSGVWRKPPPQVPNPEPGVKPGNEKYIPPAQRR